MLLCTRPSPSLQCINRMDSGMVMRVREMRGREQECAIAQPTMLHLLATKRVNKLDKYRSPPPPSGPSRRHIKSAKGGGHERSSSDSASKISLSAESSSVTSLPGLRKGAAAAEPAAAPPPSKKLASKTSSLTSSTSLPKIPKAKIGRTTSRDRMRKERRLGDDGECTCLELLADYRSATRPL